MRIAPLALTAVLTCCRAVAGQTEGQGVALTIYSTAQPGAITADMYRPSPQNPYGGQPWQQPVPGYAVVKLERPITIAEGRSTIRFTDVSAQIDPTTVSFASLTDPAGTRVLEQSYQFDLVSSTKLVERFLGREITVDQVQGQQMVAKTGKLLSTQGGLVLQAPGGAVEVLAGYSNVRLPELPGGLISKPTLVWDVVAPKAGPQRTRVTYQTGGITWWADYNVVFAEGKDAGSGVLDVGAWVSILNQSGAGYPEAKLKLIAGDVHRAPVGRQAPGAREMSMKSAMADSRGGFEEKSFFEYHLYSLGRPSTIPDNSTKQIELFDTARGVPCEKVLVYYGLGESFRGFFPDPVLDRSFGTQGNTKVDVYLQVKNSKDAGLGMPLPSGRVRVSKLDTADQTLEFIGEDVIDHTPKDENVRILLGNAFDVVGERKQLEFKMDSARRTMEEEIEVKVRNHKAEPVNVLVRESLYRWVSWEITKKSTDFQKIDSRTVHFPVTVPKDGEAVVRYTVRYTW